MALTISSEAQQRRALRRELRNVSRLLRWTGIVLAALGAGGLLAADEGDWWIGASWVSLAIGAALLAAGVVQRVRQRRRRTDGLPDS